MKIENKKLGKGLGALLSGGQDREDKTFKIINISQIHANKDQPRKNFNKND